MYTADLAQELYTALCDHHSQCPALVINTLHRSRLDPNRDKDEAAFGVAEAELAWDAYHGAVQQARTAMTGAGLLLDIHGHGHTIQRDEIGYLISRSRLNSGSFNPVYTSIRSLAASNTHMFFSDLVRGNGSLGAMLAVEGYPSVPSPQTSSPGSDKYFSGGYITRYYGSRYEGTVDGIQVEVCRSHRTLPLRTDYVTGLRGAVTNYLTTYYSVTAGT